MAPRLLFSLRRIVKVILEQKRLNQAVDEMIVELRQQCIYYNSRLLLCAFAANFRLQTKAFYMTHALPLNRIRFLSLPKIRRTSAEKFRQCPVECPGINLGRATVSRQPFHRAYPCLKIQTSDKRLRRDVKIIAPNFSHFVNATMQIDDAICDVKLIVPAFSFLQARRAQSDCRG
jgi:hypothetical protein